MGLINQEDRRPRDWAYKVAFDRKDLPSLQEMARHIRETHDTDMIEDFNLKCEQKLAGQTEAVILDNGIEIQQVTKTEDLVVILGLQHCINIILGTTSARFSHIQVAHNAGISNPTINDQALDHSGAGPFPLALSTYGWSEPRGMKLFFGCISTQTAGTAGQGGTINEIGVFNGSTDGPPSVMLNREAFKNNLILTRPATSIFTLYNAVFMFSSVIEFCPVA